MNIQEVTSKKQWEQFLHTAKPHTFLHDWEWGDVQESLGHTIWRFGIFENEKLEGVALVVKIVARRGSFLFIPHGPIIEDENYAEGLQALTNHLRLLAKEERCIFIRISSLQKDSMQSREMFSGLDFINAPIHMHPELAWVLPLDKSEDQLLKEMRKNTRYSIRKAEKDGIEIESTNDPERLKDFFPIYQETVLRQHFTPFNKKYLESEFKILSQAQKTLLFLAKYQGRVVSVAIIVFNKQSGFYHHGASSQKHSHLTASHLLQWEVIREAKRRGCDLYNFWGISPQDKSRHPWAGLSRFKMGFGGEAEGYLHAQDLVLSPFYWLNYVIETLRRLKRGL